MYFWLVTKEAGLFLTDHGAYYFKTKANLNCFTQLKTAQDKVMLNNEGCMKGLQRQPYCKSYCLSSCTSYFYNISRTSLQSSVFICLNTFSIFCVIKTNPLWLVSINLTVMFSTIPSRVKLIVGINVKRYHFRIVFF